jgi:uncharacterized protein YrrD
MEFRNEVNVYTATGDHVGKIDRVVIDPRTKKVSHVVVRKGFLLPEDKLVPIDMIASATEDHVTLRPDAGDLHTLPLFEDTYYVPLEEVVRPGMNASEIYWYPPVGGWYGTPIYPEVSYVAHTESNIPEGTVGLKEGAAVKTPNGKHIGNVERIFTENDQATHILVSHGLLLKEKKLIPVNWIMHIYEDEIELNVDASMLERLPTHEA